MSERTEPAHPNDFSISLKYCRRLPLVKNISRPKGFLSQPSESAMTTCLSKMAEKSHPVFGLENECYHIAQEWKYKRNVITPIFAHLSTLQNLKDHYNGTFVNEPGDDSLKQLNFTWKIAQFQPYLLHLMQSQVLHSKQS